MGSSGQKFIARNRAPRVQIEYDVENYGAQKKMQLPFVMGVMADLLGQQEAPPPKLEDRKFLEFDHDNFEDRLAAMQPRVATSVPNKLSEDGGTIPIDLTFRRMEDFSPASIAKSVEPLRRLLEARSQLSDLISYMDGRGEAEALIAAGLRNPGRLRALVESMAGANGADADATETNPAAEKPQTTE